MKTCNITDCQFTHPPVCETFTDTKVVCQNEHCLKQHRQLSDWHGDKTPYFEEGCWDGLSWRLPSKKLKKMWLDRKSKEEGLQKKSLKDDKGQEKIPRYDGQPNGGWGGGRGGGGGGGGGGDRR